MTAKLRTSAGRFTMAVEHCTRTTEDRLHIIRAASEWHDTLVHLWKRLAVLAMLLGLLTGTVIGALVVRS